MIGSTSSTSSEAPGQFGYRNRRAQLSLVAFPFLAVTSVSVLAQAASGNVPLGFALAWCAIVAWNSYWFLFRLGIEVSVNGSVVTWRAPLASRIVQLGDLTGNSTRWPNLERIAVVGGRPLHVITSDRGWNQFIETLNAAHPEHPFRVTNLDRFTARLLRSRTWNGFYQR